MRAKLPVVFMALLLGTVAPVRGDWSESFTGSAFDQEWDFFDDAGNSPPGATFVDPFNDVLGFVADSAQFPPNAFVLGVVGLGDTEQSFSDVRVTADVNVSPFPGFTIAGNTANTNNDIFIAARVVGTTGYLFALDFFDGTANLVRSVAGDLEVLKEVQIDSFNPLETYTLQLDVIGEDLTARVLDGDGEILQLSVTDDKIAAGFLGIGSAINDNDSDDIGPDGDDRTLLLATFDNVSSVAIATVAIPGDHDGDNRVTLIDLSLVQAGLDGAFDRVDGVQVRRNLGSQLGASPTAVPEPSALALAGFALVGLFLTLRLGKPRK